MPPLLYPDWKEKVVYAEDGPRPTPLYAQDPLKVIVAGLLPGQKIPPHPEGLAVFHFLEGRGWMIVNEDRLAVSAGSTVITKEGDTRGIEAETKLAFLAVRVTSLS